MTLSPFLGRTLAVVLLLGAIGGIWSLFVKPVMTKYRLSKRLLYGLQQLGSLLAAAEAASELMLLGILVCKFARLLPSLHPLLLL